MPARNLIINSHNKEETERQPSASNTDFKVFAQATLPVKVLVDFSNINRIGFYEFVEEENARQVASKDTFQLITINRISFSASNTDLKVFA